MNSQTAGIRCSLSILAFVIVASPLHAQLVTSEKVQKSIDQAVRYLADSQLPDGGWPEFNQTYSNGVSSLVTLALLTSGQDPEGPLLSRALQFLSEKELDRTYTVALQTMVFCYANPNKYAQQIRRNTGWLVGAQRPSGGWSYGRELAGGSSDPSNSQFALLALHEAQRVGVDLPREKWIEVFGKAKSYWESKQNRDGSFSYTSGNGSGSMTCAGIASLVIVGSQLDAFEASINGRGEIACCGSDEDNSDRIEAALDWLARNFSVRTNPGDNSHQLYYLYALERAGRMTGRRFIGTHDWYREGTEQMLILQDQVFGKIVPRSRAFLGNDYSETAFGLLFLAKGKRQVVVSRLKFGQDDDWNHHATAIQHLTAFTEQAWKRDLTWQTIDINRSSLADLLESPVLFISGSRIPAFNQRQKLLLKEYVEQGGFIYAEACNGDGCNGAAFEKFFSELVVELFDQPLEKLSPDHPVWFAESRVDPSSLPNNAWLYGVQTCCRLGVVYSPISLSCRWELNIPYGARPDYPPAVQQQLDTFAKLGVNVLSYATGKELKQKLDTVTILEEVQSEAPTDRGVFLLPTLRHNAGADDAPNAISNLIEWLDKENPFQLSSEKRLISITPEELQRYPVVFMHGRGELRLSESQRDALRKYLKNGGFLFADAICADEQFVVSFRREMEIVLGEPLENLSETHPMLTNQFYGFDIQKVEVIDPDSSGGTIVGAKRKISPRLDVARQDNRICVVFSPLDLSCALESRHSLQCQGYLRPDAAKIGINVILFALQH